MNEMFQFKRCYALALCALLLTGFSAPPLGLDAVMTRIIEEAPKKRIPPLTRGSIACGAHTGL